VSVIGRNPFVVAPRARPTAAVRLGVPLVALVAALGLGAIVLAAFGDSPIEAYRTMFESSLDGWRPFTRTLTYATPLVLTGLAAALAFRMKIYNIGAEGQLFAGAIAASGLALALPAGLPKPLLLVLVIGGGALAGAVWAQLAAIPKAVFGTDEIITTLMLNFVALGLMNYLIQGSMSFWRNPTHPVPQGKEIPGSAQLPVVYERLHAGFFVAVGAAVVVWLLVRVTPWGFRLKVIGDSPRAARYAGIGVGAMTIGVLAASGAIAGLAGAIEVSAVTKGLEPKALAIELGYTGIIIAAVARLNPLGVVPVAVFLAAITVSGSRLQSIGVPVDLVVLLQGLIFLSVTAGEFFVSHRVRLAARDRPPAPEPLRTAAVAAAVPLDEDATPVRARAGSERPGTAPADGTDPPVGAATKEVVR
jgi:simple sugar transport system permease protein